jgi:hypothetical protein
MPLRCFSVRLALLLALSATAATPALACRGDCYHTVDRPVIVREGFREIVVETEPVVVLRTERFEVAPRRVDYLMTPPVTRTVMQEIVVRRAGYRWKTVAGPYGERRRKVFVPAEVKRVPREVVVAPGRRVRVVTPPVYALRDRVVAVRPAQTIVLPARTMVYDRPPVVFRTRRTPVLVRGDGVEWLPPRAWYAR